MYGLGTIYDDIFRRRMVGPADPSQRLQQIKARMGRKQGAGRPPGGSVTQQRPQQGGKLPLGLGYAAAKKAGLFGSDVPEVVQRAAEAGPPPLPQFRLDGGLPTPMMEKGKVMTEQLGALGAKPLGPHAMEGLLAEGGYTGVGEVALPEALTMGPTQAELLGAGTEAAAASAPVAEAGAAAAGEGLLGGVTPFLAANPWILPVGLGLGAAAIFGLFDD